MKILKYEIKGKYAFGSYPVAAGSCNKTCKQREVINFFSKPHLLPQNEDSPIDLENRITRARSPSATPRCIETPSSALNPCHSWVCCRSTPLHTCQSPSSSRCHSRTTSIQNAGSPPRTTAVISCGGLQPAPRRCRRSSSLPPSRSPHRPVTELTSAPDHSRQRWLLPNRRRTI